MPLPVSYPFYHYISGEKEAYKTLLISMKDGWPDQLQVNQFEDGKIGRRSQKITNPMCWQTKIKIAGQEKNCTIFWNPEGKDAEKLFLRVDNEKGINGQPVFKSFNATTSPNSNRYGQLTWTDMPAGHSKELTAVAKQIEQQPLPQLTSTAQMTRRLNSGDSKPEKIAQPEQKPLNKEEQFAERLKQELKNINSPNEKARTRAQSVLHKLTMSISQRLDNFEKQTNANTLEDKLVYLQAMKKHLTIAFSAVGNSETSKRELISLYNRVNRVQEQVEKTAVTLPKSQSNTPDDQEEQASARQTAPTPVPTRFRPS